MVINPARINRLNNTELFESTKNIKIIAFFIHVCIIFIKNISLLLMLKALRLNSFLSLFFICIFFFQWNSAYAQLNADFAADTSVFCAPYTVSFVNLSTGNPTSFLWDLGNGNSSTASNPQATYINPGNYTIKLTISDGTDTDSTTKINFIVAKRLISRFNRFLVVGIRS